MQFNKSEELFIRAKKVSPGGVHSPVRGFRGVGGSPIFIKSAIGSHLTDVDENQYIDFCMSWGPLLFGHQDPEVGEAVIAAISRGWSYGTAETYSLELAEFITREIPWVEKIRFVNSGTEAVMTALRLARAATKRNKIVKFDGCYHGHVDSMLTKAGSGLAEMASPDSAGVTESTAEDTIVVPLNDLNAVKKAFENFSDQIAAVIVEPVPANNGLLPHASGFLQNLREITKKYGALLIFDEVITGFRISFGGMAARENIRPDIVTYGKIIGGGFPVGAYGGRSDLMEMVAPLGPVYQAGTLSANPVAMCAGLAMVQKIKRVQPYSKLENVTEKLCSEIRSLIKKYGVDISVQNYSSLFWCVLGKSNSNIVRSIDEIPASQKPNYAKVFHFLLNKGIYLAPSGYEVSFLSTAHTDSDLNQFLEAFEASLK